MNFNYNERFEKGIEYQKNIEPFLIELGYPPFYYETKQEQLEGEGAGRIEVKYDSISPQTKRYWIEIKEKTDPANKEYIYSGILRHDNSIYYCIGNNIFFHIFDKETLIDYYHSLEEKDIKENNTKTSLGFFLSFETANKICIKKQLLSSKAEEV